MKKNYFNIAALIFIAVLPGSAAACRQNQIAGENRQSAPVVVGSQKTQNRTIADDAEDFIPQNGKLIAKAQGDLNNDGLEDTVLAIAINENAKYKVDGETRTSKFFIRRLIILLRNDRRDLEMAAENDNVLVAIPDFEQPNPPSAEVSVNIKDAKIIVNQTDGFSANSVKDYETFIQNKKGLWFVVKDKAKTTDIHTSKEKTVTRKKSILLTEYSLNY